MLFQKFIRILQANRISGGKSYISESEAEAIFEEFYKRYAQGKYEKSYQSGSSSQNYKTSANNTTYTKEKPYYDALELPFGAGFDEIKASYRKLVKLYHPDKFQYDAEKCRIAEKIMKGLNEAFAYFEKKFGK
jgi:DnaJ-domain-containing protein 1